MAYQWWRFLHFVGVFGFLLAHGVAAGVGFRLRKERDRARLSALLDLSARSLWGMYVSLVVLIGAGVVLGFITNAWSRGWIWVAIGVLVLMILSMYALAAPYFRRLRTIATTRRGGGFKHTDEELQHVLSSPRPIVVAVVGFAGLVVILWLMVLRPF